MRSALAQTLPLVPEQMTNRRLGYLNDATAVGWNPAALGTRQSLELMASVPLTQGFAPRGPFAMFAKLSPFAVGYAGNPADSIAQLYAGVGFSVWDDVLWLGASGRLYNKGELNKLSVASLRYAASAVVHPVRGLFVGLTASTMGQEQSENTLYFTGNMNYSPLSWLTAFVGYSSYTPSVQRRVESGAFSLAGGFDAGMSASLLNDLIVLSGNYNFTNAAARLSAEVNIGGFGAGLISESGFAGYTAIARFSSDPVRSVATLYDTRADDDGCRVPADTLYAQPEYLVKQTASYNPKLADTLARRFTPQGTQATLSNLYNAIQRRYYASHSGRAKTIAGDSINIGVQRNQTALATQVLNVQNTAYPNTTVVLRAFDSTGKTVGGLGMKDFFLQDTALQLVSVVPTDSTARAPVDVVLVIDCSGSMQNKIDATRKNARAFVDSMRARGADYRIGGILYGVNIVDVLEPTRDFARFERFIAKAKANQPDEYAPLALDELARMKFRPNAQRIAVLITDELTFVGPRAGEEEITSLNSLWAQGIRTYSIVKFCDDNSARLAWLTLGRQYSISDPFDQILNQIGADITTTYTVTYKRKEQPAAPEKITLVTGAVTNERGVPVPATVLFRDAEQNTLGPKATDSAGRFMQNIVEGKTYTAVVEAAEPRKYLPFEQTVDLTTARKGDTLRLPELVLKQATYLRGVVKAESGELVAAEITLSEISLSEIGLKEEGLSALFSGTEPLANDETTGKYFTEVSAGKRYKAFVQPYLRDRDTYLPLTTTLDLSAVQKGDTAVHDFVLRLNPREVQLTGTITAAQPAPSPIGGVTVTVADAGTGKTLSQSASSADGRYSVAVPKDVDALIIAQAGSYYPDTTRMRVSRRDTSSQATHDFTPEWKNVSVTGRVESAKTGQTIVQAQITANDGSTTLTQTTTDANGNYRLVVPKEAKTVVVGQSNEYFYDSFELQPRRGDTATLRRTLRLQEELTLRINFPTDQFNNPTPYILDSNGVMTSTTWQSELERVAKVIVFDRTFITKLTLVGHTDDAAADEYNMKLGQRRAEFVRDELVKRGVPAELLETRSKGESALLPRRTGEPLEQFRARCRRVELVKVNMSK
jgi:outer membrane protein OmpA-like peptidoglycan-associated protein